MAKKPQLQGGKRYSAKLLFQFRVMCNGSPGKRRLCEERIITFASSNAKSALREAKKEVIWRSIDIKTPTAIG